MNYKLAKKLEEAGFPDVVMSYPEKMSDPIKWVMPSLSELIYECGDNISSIHREGACWYASQYVDTDLSNEGSTPEEAVANLWLKLNGK